MPDNTFELQVVLVEDETGWIAHGLQYSLSARGETLRDVLYAFEPAGGRGFSGLRRPPSWWENPTETLEN